LAFAIPISKTQGYKDCVATATQLCQLFQAMIFMMSLPQSEEMRRNMVDSQLRTSGVNAPWIINAMLATAREAFVPGNQNIAYMDRAIPLGDGRMMNPPVAAGQMLTIAEPRQSDHVILIGAGTGYLAALILGRVASLVAVEESTELSAVFRTNLPEVALVEGANAAGAADYGPFDLIIVDGAIEMVPDALIAQLKDGGRIVAGLVEGPVSRLAAGIKHGDHLVLRAVHDMEIAPLPGFAKAKEFVF
jgi:protein-L-isoaspartate(D-aspartate) O-methyltransferase